MLIAGISWSEQGFEVAFRDASGATAAPPVHFPAGQVATLTSHLCDVESQSPDELVCVVDSTDGMVDGRLMAAGLRVHRADPRQLPERPVLGSVPADTLASTAAEGLPELARLTLAEGSLTGRSDDHVRAERDSEDALAGLAAAGRCLTRGASDPSPGRVALTFDDGPNPPWTGRILDVLERYDVPATFFCVGLHASGRSEELARMAEAGHGIANHTWSHPFLPDLAQREVEVQLQRTDEVIEAVVGVRERRLFRPPYGSGTRELYSWLAGDTGSRPAAVVLWDVDTQDWAMPGSDVIATSALEQARPGSVVLMHDGGGDRTQTVDALPAVVEGLLERGYELVRVEELLDGSGPLHR
ncbi:MAG: peptidoglycan-N-acetylglucosamine deacetylase [Nocardioidaceae bacterium]|jgi:peptidoglycan/xylan/chitin deacetylase (PgdA/CDA1 family)|nr:peptidoglycan-N-acetylglucosamine deacetylase [Nocardioidaceae bacterium]